MSMCKITLSTSGTTHCGYCSDPDNISSYVKKDRIFVIHDFPHKGYYNYNHPIDLNSDFNIDKDIIAYCRSKYNKKNYCTIGSGYCGCGERFTVKKIKIIAKKDGSGGELPHVCTPLFNGADTIVETLDGSGDAPPTLGEAYMGPKLTRAVAVPRWARAYYS